MDVDSVGWKAKTYDDPRFWDTAHLPPPLPPPLANINTYFSLPKAEWAIDSEAMRERGIIVLVKSN